MAGDVSQMGRPEVLPSVSGSSSPAKNSFEMVTKSIASPTEELPLDEISQSIEYDDTVEAEEEKMYGRINDVQPSVAPSQKLGSAEIQGEQINVGANRSAQNGDAPVPSPQDLSYGSKVQQPVQSKDQLQRAQFTQVSQQQFSQQLFGFSKSSNASSSQQPRSSFSNAATESAASEVSQTLENVETQTSKRAIGSASAVDNIMSVGTDAAKDEVKEDNGEQEVAASAQVLPPHVSLSTSGGGADDAAAMVEKEKDDSSDDKKGANADHTSREAMQDLVKEANLVKAVESAVVVSERVPEEGETEHKGQEAGTQVESQAEQQEHGVAVAGQGEATTRSEAIEGDSNRSGTANVVDELQSEADPKEVSGDGERIVSADMDSGVKGEQGRQSEAVGAGDGQTSHGQGQNIKTSDSRADAVSVSQAENAAAPTANEEADEKKQAETQDKNKQTQEEEVGREQGDSESADQGVDDETVGAATNETTSTINEKEQSAQQSNVEIEAHTGRVDEAAGGELMEAGGETVRGEMKEEENGQQVGDAPHKEQIVQEIEEKQQAEQLETEKDQEEKECEVALSVETGTGSLEVELSAGESCQPSEWVVEWSIDRSFDSEITDTLAVQLRPNQEITETLKKNIIAGLTYCVRAKPVESQDSPAKGIATEPTCVKIQGSGLQEGNSAVLVELSYSLGRKRKSSEMIMKLLRDDVAAALKLSRQRVGEVNFVDADGDLLLKFLPGSSLSDPSAAVLALRLSHLLDSTKASARSGNEMDFCAVVTVYTSFCCQLSSASMSPI